MILNKVSKQIKCFYLSDYDAFMQAKSKSKRFAFLIYHHFFKLPLFNDLSLDCASEAVLAVECIWHSSYLNYAFKPLLYFGFCNPHCNWSAVWTKQRNFFIIHLFKQTLNFSFRKVVSTFNCTFTRMLHQFIFD